MNKIKNNKLFRIVINGLMTGLMGIILWPLFDLILCKVITKSPFMYSVHEHIIQPIIFGFIISIVIDLTFKRKN